MAFPWNNPNPIRAAVLVVFGALAACAAPVATAPNGINDPAEQVNRKVHALNTGLDRYALRPASKVYGAVVPVPVTIGLSNLSSNLNAPVEVANRLLQGRPVPALRTTARFFVNTLLGFGGLVDPATLWGLNRDDTDFGETLAVWGLGEGAYVELPALGPSTTRDAAGKLVDYAMNPTRLLTPPASDYVTGVRIGTRIGDRARYSDTVDSLLYDSADSYAQSRLLYLQNRRFTLGEGSGAGPQDAGAFDPYEDPYAK
ncbi:MAG: VacJ family lipoprotein [Rhodobacteraceae bacterium]|nr:VacJ family lipoprotein [Paracoccaceae bacterium]